LPPISLNYVLLGESKTDPSFASKLRCAFTTQSPVPVPVAIPLVMAALLFGPSFWPCHLINFALIRRMSPVASWKANKTFAEQTRLRRTNFLSFQRKSFTAQSCELLLRLLL